MTRRWPDFRMPAPKPYTLMDYFVILLLASVLVAVIAGGFAVALLTARPAHARDLDGRYANSPLHEWYSSLCSRAGAWCCDESDGQRAETWGTEGGSYWVAVGKSKVKIDPGQLVDGPNKAGHAIVWIMGGNVRCFMPGTMS